jgi:5-methyltetrahydropteroyltriglutamate--homocysteine methyltransferase
MFATYAGGYSRNPLPGLPDVLGPAERDLREARIDAARYQAIADDFVREILKEMAVVQVSIVGDGGVRWPDRVLPLIDALDGLSAGGEVTLPDGEPATRPMVTGPVRWTRPITVRDWQFANAETNLWVKETVIGPYTLAALAEPAAGRRRARLALELGEALNAEIRALLAVGCPMVEVDEPMAGLIGDDAREWQALRGAHGRLMRGVDDSSEIHLSLGLWGGALHPAGHGPLIELPYSSYLVAVLAGPSAWRFIAAVPPHRGIVVGAGDAHTETMDETEVLVWAMAWAAEGERGSQRVGVAPNGSLCFVPRHFAHRKLLRAGEAVSIASMGPLHDVAEALDPEPVTSRMAELRAMAEAVNAGRAV